MKIIAGNSYIKKYNNQVLIDSINLNDFLEKSKTPFFIFLENKIRDNIKTFLKVFRTIFKNIQVFYSFKANFLPEICSIIKSEGIGAELISLPELKLALKVGFSPNKIILGGPYLTEELIELSIKEKIKEIIIYDLDSLKKIDKIAQKFKRIQKVCLRVKSLKYGSKMGITLSDQNITKLMNLKKKYKNIEINTILSHYSTQMNSPEQFNQNIKTIFNNFQILLTKGFKLKNINLGGGFPENTIMPEDQLKKVALSMRKNLYDLNLKEKTFYFEPGRYFVGDTGILIAKIINISQNRWINLNIGNHICPKFARCSLRFYNASQINSPHKYKTSIAGIIPTDQDVLAKNFFLTRELKKGDIILITNVGAYTLTFSNRFPYALPDIFLVKNSEIKQIFNTALNHDFSLF